MLRLPLTSVLLASVLLASDGLDVMPLVIVAVVVAHVLSARFTPSPAPAAACRPDQQAADGATQAGASRSAAARPAQL